MGRLVPLCKMRTEFPNQLCYRRDPHYVIFGGDKILPYDLLKANPAPVYNEDDYIKGRINKFQVIYQRVKEHMKKVL